MNIQKTISSILVLCLLLTMMPISARAESYIEYTEKSDTDVLSAGSVASEEKAANLKKWLRNYSQYGSYTVNVGELFDVTISMPSPNKYDGKIMSETVDAKVESVMDANGEEIKNTYGQWIADATFPYRGNSARITAVFPNPGTYYIFINRLRRSYTYTIGGAPSSHSDSWNVYKRIEVNVQEIPTTQIIVTPENIALEVGDTYKLGVEVKPSNASYPAVVFRSGNTGVVDVDKNGNLYALAPGAAVIHVESEKYPDIGDTCLVTVTKHSHTYSESVTQPSCTEPGSVTYTCGCGDSYQETIPEKGHTEVVDKAKAPSCTQSGLTEGKHCSVCNTVLLKQTEISPTGHTPNLDAPTEEEDQVCTVCGTVLAEKLGHICANHYLIQHLGKKPTCTEDGVIHHYICPCGKYYADRAANEELTDIVIPAVGHTWADANCTTAKTCTVCGATEGEPLGHRHTALITEPTCTEQGYTTYTCACGDSYVADYVEAWGHHCNKWETRVLMGDLLDCDDIHCWENGGEEHCKGIIEYGKCERCSENVTRDVDGTVHDLTYYPEKPATCTEDGWYAYEVCSRCTHNTFHVWKSIGHLVNNRDTVVTPPTCTERGYSTWYCIVCECSGVSDEVPALGHEEMTDPAVEPSCLTDGYTEGKHCARCGMVIAAQTTIPAVGHTEQVVVGKEATCTEAGVTDGKKCTVCGTVTVKQETIPVKGHKEETIPGKAASCTENGLSEGKKCSVCGTVTVKQETIAAKGHKEETIPGKAATCTEDGLTKGRKCSVCGTITLEQEKIPVIAHKEETIPGKAATCTEDGLTEGKRCTVCGTVTVAQMPIKAAGHVYTDDKDPTCNVCGEEREIKTDSIPMFRMYDPNSGEHFYTGSEVERDFLVNAGWHYEGVGFNFPEKGAPVHRLYDSVFGEHLYTMDKQEMNRLLARGWNYEGVAFNSAGVDAVPQYRLHNPNAKRGGYHFTGSVEERDLLISFGWIPQGIGWYSCLE